MLHDMAHKKSKKARNKIVFDKTNAHFISGKTKQNNKLFFSFYGNQGPPRYKPGSLITKLWLLRCTCTMKQNGFNTEYTDD